LLLLLFLIFLVGGILIGAFRIILGWVLPAPTLKRFDAAVSMTFGFIFKLCVVALAGIILWAIWLAFSKPT
jgi:hypothetical protein